MEEEDWSEVEWRGGGTGEIEKEGEVQEERGVGDEEREKERDEDDNANSDAMLWCSGADGASSSCCEEHVRTTAVTLPGSLELVRDTEVDPFFFLLLLPRQAFNNAVSIFTFTRLSSTTSIC